MIGLSMACVLQERLIKSQAMGPTFDQEGKRVLAMVIKREKRPSPGLFKRQHVFIKLEEEHKRENETNVNKCS